MLQIADISPELLTHMQETLGEMSEMVNKLVGVRDGSLDQFERLSAQVEFIKFHRHYDKLVEAWTYIQDLQFKLFWLLDFISEDS